MTGGIRVALVVEGWTAERGSVADLVSEGLTVEGESYKAEDWRHD